MQNQLSRAWLILALVLASCSGMGKQPPATSSPDSEPTAAVPEMAQETASSLRDRASALPFELDESLPLDPAIRFGRFDNGLTYYIRAHDEPRERAELRLAVAAGSALEDEDQRGLAHFLEHMAFNGTEHFERQELVDYLETIGMRFGADVNAYTSFDQTVYMLTVPTDDPELLERGFLILSDWARAISLEAEEIDKERGVVLEEWRLGRGAGARMWDQQYPILLQGSRYAERLPIGKPEIIETAKPEALESFYRRWYRPDLMAVVAVGDFDPDRIEALLRASFEGLEGPDIAPEKTAFPVPSHAETLFDVVTDPEATQTQVEIYYKKDRESGDTPEDYYRSIVQGLYHGMLNERLGEIARRPDPPYLYAYSGAGNFVQPLDVLYQAAGVSDGGIERGLETLLTEVERVERHGFLESELERAKADLLRQFDRAFLERDKIKSSSFAGEYIRNFLDGEPAPGIEVERDLVRALIPDVSLDEIDRIASNWIAESSRVILVRAPESTSETLPDEAAVTALFDRARGLELDPWQDRVRDEPLLPDLPEAGSIVAESRIEEIDVTEWTLSNGIRVVLKPTDFKNDQVVLRGYSPGGSSLFEDADWSTARFTNSVVSEGGLGAFDRIELEKALTGKIAQARVSISELGESASGIASPEDLETLFQLLYLRFTAPRRDPEAFASMMTRTRAWIEHRKEDPNAVFGDRWQQVISQNHLRREPITPELLDEVDLDRAMELFAERFADNGDFVFIIVGNIDLDGLRPLVERYLASLPATGDNESWRDIGVEKPPGQVRFEIQAGLEPKSRVQLYFHGKEDFSIEKVHQASSLSSALRIRLREVLREDLGNTYGVSVSSSVHDRPRETYSSRVAFGCAPESVDESLAALEEELARFREDGPSAEIVAKVQEMQRRERETSLRENGFWIGVLGSYYRRGEDPRRILEYDALVDSLTPELLRDAARRYFDPERSVLGVLYPAEAEDEEGAPADS